MARRRRDQVTGGFNPAQLSAISAWLRLEGSTITGSGYSSVRDLLNPSNPAVQTADGSRPPNSNSANGLPRADFDGSTDFLSWAAASNNNQTGYSGFATWVEFDAVNDGQKGIYCALSGASTRLELTKNNADLLVDINHSQFSSRRATSATVFAAATKYFLTWEFDKDGASDATKCVFSLNAAVLSPSFSDSAGAPGAMPSSLVSTAGPFVIGARNSTPIGPLNGKIGPNIFILGSKMAGATQGLLTSAARTLLMNFEAPT